MNNNVFQLKEPKMVSTDQVTAARFLGFLQADGHIGFTITRREFNVRISISASQNNVSILRKYFGPWLQSKGISIVFNKRREEGGSVGLIVERQANVLRLIKILEEAVGDLPTLLVDDKLFQYNALKKAFELNDLRKTANIFEREYFLKQLVDLRIGVIRINKLQRGGIVTEKDGSLILASRTKLETSCNVENTEGHATGILEELKARTNEQCEQLVKYLQNNNITWKHSSETLQDFIMGVLEGDGSFQVGFSTRNLLSRKVFANFYTLVTLTDSWSKSTSEHFLFRIFKIFFQSKTGDRINTRSNADRIYMKSSTEIQNVIYLVNNRKFVNENDAKRFCCFEFCVEHSKEILQNKEMCLFLIEKWSEFGEEKYLKYSKEQRIRLIHEYFEDWNS